MTHQATRLAEEIKRHAVEAAERYAKVYFLTQWRMASHIEAVRYEEKREELFAAIDALLALVQPAVSEEAEMGDRSAGYAFTVKNPDTVWDNFLWRGQEIKRLRAELENCASRIHGQREEIVRLEAARAQSSSKGDEGMQHE